MESLCKWVNSQINVLLIVEEADVFAHAKPSRVSPEFYKVFHIGRERNIGSICVTRRIGNFNSDLSTQAEHIIAFHMLQPDVEYLEKWMPDANKLNGLPEYHYLYYSDRTGTTTIRKPVPLT